MCCCNNGCSRNGCSCNSCNQYRNRGGLFYAFPINSRNGINNFADSNNSCGCSCCNNGCGCNSARNSVFFAMPVNNNGCGCNFANAYSATGNGFGVRNGSCCGCCNHW
ncbi:MAG: hypothetical protein OSJ67_02905 [Clostridia bacterium]|nr:hypothetical protein [Clostridia bacterium]